MNQRVLATFLNLRGWTFLTGSMIFEAGISLGAMGLTCRVRHSPPLGHSSTSTFSASRPWL